MKSIFLVALVFLVTNWPTPSASWSLNQQYGNIDSSNAFAQQGYESQIGGSGRLMNNGFRLNPELFQSNDDRRAFSRTVGSNGGRARKLSSTRFNLKPFDQMENEDIEEFAPEQFQEQKLETPQQQKQEVQQQKVEQPQQTISIAELAQEASKKVEAEQKKEVKQDAKQDVKQDTKQDVKQEVKQEIKNEATGVQQKAAVADQEQQTSSKNEFIKPLNFKAPMRQQQWGNRPIMSQFQQQQPIFQQQRQPIQQQQQQADNIDQFRFQLGKADMVHTVDMNTLKNEAIRTMSTRNENQGIEVPLSGKYQQPYNNYHGGRFGGDRDNDDRRDNGERRGDRDRSLAEDIEKDAKRVLNGFDTIKGTFSSLIIIVNTNANDNTEVSSIDVDLMKSFLGTYFLGKSVENVLRDADLSKLVDKFNEEHSKTYKSDSDSGDKYSKDGKYESTSKLSANIPVLTNEPAKATDAKSDVKGSSTHSENTIIVKKETDQNDDSVNLNYKNYGYGHHHPQRHHIPGGGYYYLPTKKGGIIIINNYNNNENIHKRVKYILSGKDYNTSPYSTGMLLPLRKEEIKTLMDDAIIVNNNNENKNGS